MNKCLTCLSEFDPAIATNKGYCSSACAKKSDTIQENRPMPNDNNPRYSVADLLTQITNRDNQLYRLQADNDQLKLQNFDLKLENSTAKVRSDLEIERQSIGHSQAMNGLEAKKTNYFEMFKDPAMLQAAGSLIKESGLSSLISQFGSKGGAEQKIKAVDEQTQKYTDNVLLMLREYSMNNQNAVIALYNAGVYYGLYPKEMEENFLQLEKKYEDSQQEPQQQAHMTQSNDQ